MGFHEQMGMRTCGHCGLLAQMHEVATNYLGRAPRAFGDSYYSFLECRGCGGFIILEHSAPGVGNFSENQIYPDGGGTSEGIKHLPEDVAKYLKKARRVLQAGVPDSAAVQLRRTLEAAAAHFGVKERVLVRSISELIEQGMVTKQFANALHHVRDVGNQGAHAGDEDIDAETAEQALSFTVQLLRNLFEVPGELQKIEERKAQTWAEDDAEN